MLAVYQIYGSNITTATLNLLEQFMYGSSRLGSINRNLNMDASRPDIAEANYTHLGKGNLITFIRGNKLFEIANHLGTVNMTVTDQHLPVLGSGSQVLFTPKMASAEDFTPFGMRLQGRIWDGGGGAYRFKFNGKERIYEINGRYNQYDYGMRIYDDRLGRFLSTDPLTARYPFYTPYQYAGNSPILFVDLDGLERALPWYLRESKYGKKPVLTFGLGNLPTLEKLKHGDQPWYTDEQILTFASNTLVSAWNNVAETWNDALDGKTGSDMVGESVRTLGDMGPGDFKHADTWENIGGGILTAYAIKKFSGGKFSVDLPPGAKINGFSFINSTASKFAFQFGKCVEYVSAFKNDFANAIKESGGQIKIFDINVGKNGLIGTAEKQLSNNGFHRYAEVTIENQVKIFDNFHPEGIAKDDYFKKIGAFTSDRKIIEGAEMSNYIKEVKE